MIKIGKTEYNENTVFLKHQHPLQKKIKMLKKTPFVLLILMIVIGFIHSWIPLPIQSMLYGISLSIKSIIMFFLPVIIFSLLFKTSSGLTHNASKIVFTLLLAVCLSNFISTMLSYCVGHWIYGFNWSMSFPESLSELPPRHFFTLPRLISNDIAMATGIFLGLILGRWKAIWAQKLASILDVLSRYILKFFIFIMPLFIIGFIIKMSHDQIMGLILKHYGLIFALTGCSILSYLFCLYFFAQRHGHISWIQSLKNMLPAAMTGFGSMSSAAAMPLTLIGTEKNAKNPETARSIIPATVNIHLIGDCFAIPIFAFAILKNFGIPEPSLMGYLTFACYFVIAKFSVAAVPGGGILVMLPILERYLGFDSTMLSLITALYILFDPVITAANVLGNGGFAVLLSRMTKKNKAVATAQK